MIYTWQKAVVENAARAFDSVADQKGASSREAELARRIEQLEAKLAKKDAIIAEISEEYVNLKKELGEP
jgi:hypothetical protein